jgi:hypothetical protein
LMGSHPRAVLIAATLYPSASSCGSAGKVYN